MPSQTVLTATIMHGDGWSFDPGRPWGHGEPGWHGSVVDSGQRSPCHPLSGMSAAYEALAWVGLELSERLRTTAAAVAPGSPGEAGLPRRSLRWHWGDSIGPAR